MCLCRWLVRALVTIPGALAVVASEGLAASEPPIDVPVPPASIEEVEELRSRNVAMIERPAVDSVHRGAQESVGDPEVPRILNACQRAKLARARAAIERARADGTLAAFQPSWLEVDPARAPSESERAKRERAATQEPLPYSPGADATPAGS